ncbi:MAG: threonylcarbamoyl-AMP synthase [Acidobacteriaceae bacterium]|nr:threonylcarbamoyl-AMP synthase [Acidobacteriaceae bacterium]
MSEPPTEEEIARAAELIRHGGLVAFPTETVYGLGANALDAKAVARIYEVKGRPWASPLIVHVADEAMARSVTSGWPTIAQTLAKHFWPGPLTLVLGKADVIPDLVTAGLHSVGVRMPAHPVAIELIRRAGVPIAAPSANPFTQISPTTAEHVRAALGDRVGMILDGGPTMIGIESTVASIWRDPPVILRPGMITQEELQKVTERPWEREMGLPQIMESPGMQPRHYAPRTPFYVLEPGTAAPAGRGRILEMPPDPQSFAAKLYAELHGADQQGWDWIGVTRPPDTPEWAGILDRLTKASARE